MRLRIRLVLTIVVLLASLAIVAAGPPEEAFWDAARAGDLDKMKQLVTEGVDVNAPTRYQATALSFACDKGHLEVVKYLVENGADLNPKDSFYEFTPIGWASFNEHVEIIELLLEKGAEGADLVLSMGVRNNNSRMVAAALKVEGLDSAAVLQARQQVKSVDDSAEIAAMLEAVEIEVPETTAVAVAPELLASYVGNYNNEQIGLALEIRLEDGNLVAQATGQPSLGLTAVSDARFDATEVPNLSISFSGRGGLIESATVHQGGQDLPFPRVTETAEAPEAQETAPAAEELKTETAAAPEPIARGPQQNWPTFRGVQASGIADGQGAPTTWDVTSGENILWKTPIPGLANASPIVWGDQVFITTAISGANDDTFRTGLYGDVDSVDDESEHTFKLYALQRTTGKIEWERTVATRVPGAKRHLKSTQANSTPVTDGKRVCALFGTIGKLACYDMKGKSLWGADVGILDAGWFYDKTYQWGHASSPVIYKNLIIVQADVYKDSFIGAWNLKDGSPAWRTSRDELPTWGSPTIYRGKDRDELITNGTSIRGYDPASGKILWTLAPNSEVTVATPIIANDLFYVTAGYPPVRPIYAIRPGGNGDISLADEISSSDAIAWSHDSGGTYMPTPIAYDGHLYTCANDGRLTAYNATDGERVYRQRIGGGSFTASPIAADGKLYFTSEEGDIVVATAGSTYTELARNEMNEICMATPAISDGVMVVRTLGHVFGIGEASVDP
ncbi:MAG: PQQ-binding-like beta-propeller repeat protein [Acidobacteriota bacterium]|nr:PQQ-binding-like beta-propeller repeat protein [Acidobacteriota bacterium]